MKSKTVTFGIILILLLSLVSLFFLTLKRPEYKFVYNADALLTQIIQPGNQYNDIKSMENKDNTIVFVDVRSKNQYIKGHLPNAINIYKASVLDAENYKIFKDLQKNKKRVILYGQDMVEANAPYMILKQIGIDNVELLPKGYEYYSSGVQTDSINLTKNDFIDFVSFIKKEQAIAEQKAKEVNTVVKEVHHSSMSKAKKTIEIQKKDTDEEEDEGC